jgi:hypothetical protein
MPRQRVSDLPPASKRSGHSAFSGVLKNKHQPSAKACGVLDKRSIFIDIGAFTKAAQRRITASGAVFQHPVWKTKWPMGESIYDAILTVCTSKPAFSFRRAALKMVARLSRLKIRHLLRRHQFLFFQ